MTISVCTLGHGRADHLTNMVLALDQSIVRPGELVVAVMQQDRYRLPRVSFPIRQVMMGASGIPLAAARNCAAKAANGDLLIFLDIDCLPAPALVADYRTAAQSCNGVMMGEVAYLPKGATANGIDFAAFDAVGVTHSERAGAPIDAFAPCRDYRCFWSLNFAIAAADFHAIGGFDERYRGYGGEDTDFGRTVALHDKPLWWVRGAKAYHQYHPHHMPPVHHLDSVLANVDVFIDKWGEPTMQHWLRAFVLMGLVEPTASGWRKVRDPAPEHLALTLQQADQPYASSAAVLVELEAAAAPEIAAR